MVDFSALKKANSIEAISKKIAAQSESNERTEDTRYWKLERDKAGNGSAVIRFLPAPAADGDDAVPFVRLWNHGFKGPSGKWYIENSLTTLKKKDPVSEYNSMLWNMTNDDNSPERKQARDQKRRLTYIANILVISDPANPDNNGKVFLYKFGQKIYNKIEGCIEPPFDEMGRAKDHPQYDPSSSQFNPFCFWKGANFRLRCRMVAGYPNYDESAFDSSKPVYEDDAKIEALWKSEHSLLSEISPDKFKTYEELKAHLENVLELTPSGTAPLAKAAAPAPVKKSIAELIDDEIPTHGDDEDDDLKAFKALAE